MKSVGRVSILFRAVFLLLVATSVCRAAWDFTVPGEPNRNWGVALANGVQYDDNWNGTEFNRESGFRYSSDLTLRAKIPWERSLLSGQYDYGIFYPATSIPGGVDQTHTLNASVNYNVNPRLLLSLNENFVDSLQPQLVQGPSGAPVTIIQAGTYLYDLVGGSASYSMTPRWTASVSGNWDIWRYQEAAYATNYDHEDYSVTLSALYSVDTRTVVGVNYQYAADTYTHPGFDNGLNAYSNTGYLSLSHQFNPKLALVLNGGYTVRNAENGTSSTAPSAYGSLIYNYGPFDSISLVVAESLSAASVQYTRTYSTQQTESLDLKVNHRFTARLHTVVEVTYSDNTFSEEVVNQELQLQNAKPSDQAITAHWGIGYDFRIWLSAGMDYYYSRLFTSDVNLVQPYSRDQIGVRVTLSY
ncbi:MAG: hypothetical protein ABSD58_17595 [Verrucomicrobiia bacterium]